MNNKIISKINELVLESIDNIYISDVFNDNIKNYNIKNGKLNLLNEENLTSYLEKAKLNISKESLSSYMNMFSIPKLEEELKSTDDKNILYYKTLDGNNKKLTSTLVDDGNNKLIISFDISFEADDEKLSSNVKYDSLLEALSDSILKIGNAFNVNKSTDIKYIEEYINSILFSLANNFKELKKSLNKTARDVSSLGEDTILIIDDDLVTRNMIKKIFNDEYKIVMLENGKEAIDYFESNKNKNVTESVDNVLGIFLDLTMPVMDGFGVLKYLNENDIISKIPVIIISGDYEKETKTRVYNYSIADMLEKPFDLEVVKHRISNFINLYRSSNSLNELVNAQVEKEDIITKEYINTYMYDYEDNINFIKEKFKSLALKTMEEYPEYGLDEEKIDIMCEAVKYYDIGLYSVPKKILNKKSPLTDLELEKLKEYPLFSSKIIDSIYGSSNDEVLRTYASNIALYYHENYNGTGYPNGVKEDEIPIESQIAAICITYTNLYNENKDAKGFITHNSNVMFNPKLIESFKEIIDNDDKY